jgi:hypothetical protein
MSIFPNEPMTEFEPLNKASNEEMIEDAPIESSAAANLQTESQPKPEPPAPPNVSNRLGNFSTEPPESSMDWRSALNNIVGNMPTEALEPPDFENVSADPSPGFEIPAPMLFYPTETAGSNPTDTQEVKPAFETSVSAEISETFEIVPDEAPAVQEIEPEMNPVEQAKAYFAVDELTAAPETSVSEEETENAAVETVETVSESSYEQTEDEHEPSELSEPRWSVITFDECALSGLTYQEAAKFVQMLQEDDIPGLCIVTDEAARRVYGAN